MSWSPIWRVVGAVDWNRTHAETFMPPAEVRLIIAKKEARLIFKNGDDIIEDELWKFDTAMTAKEQKELARILFDEGYDLMQFSVHGE